MPAWHTNVSIGASYDMNIFFLDQCPRIAAEMMHDKHVVKMILETAQILSTVCHRHGTWTEGMYRPTHANHPSVRWAGDSATNFYWLVEHGQHLCNEFHYRYSRYHKSGLVIDLCAAEAPRFTTLHWTEPAQAMPDEFKIPGDAIAAYRAYYLGRKVEQSGWTRRPAPAFVLKRGLPTMAKKSPKVAAQAATPAADGAAPAEDKKFIHNRKLALEGTYGPESKITWLINKNPRMPGRATFDRFADYFGAETVKAYMELGGTKGDLLWDLRSGYLSIEGVQLGGELTPRAERAPKAPKPAAAPRAPRGRKSKTAAVTDAVAPSAVEEETVVETID